MDRSTGSPSNRRSDRPKKELRVKYPQACGAFHAQRFRVLRTIQRVRLRAFSQRQKDIDRHLQDSQQLQWKTASARRHPDGRLITARDRMLSDRGFLTFSLAIAARRNLLEAHVLDGYFVWTGDVAWHPGE